MRLRLRRLLLNDTAILTQAEIAVRTTAATLAHASAPGIWNYSLCHGDCCNADSLLCAADVLDRPELRADAEAVGIRTLQQFEEARAPWPCGVMGAGETPNLLLGLSGIGYFYLRLHDPDIPTVMMSATLPRPASDSPST